MTTQNQFYDHFFAHGGWQYNPAKERKFFEQRIVPLAQWQQGHRILELGAGTCLHAEVLRTMGFRMTAVEASSGGVKRASAQYPKLNIVHADVSDWSPEGSVEHIFVRGMSYYHYELTGINSKGVDVPAETARFFKWLRPSGTFVLQVVTDFGGGHAETGVHMNRLSDYIELFKPLGKIIGCTDWSGRGLPWKSPEQMSGKTDRGIILVVRKP